MRRAILASVVSALLTVVAAGCGDSGVTVDLATVSVDTVVDKDFINAGETFRVSCIVTDAQGREVHTDTAFTVVPGKAVIVSGADVTPGNPGAYEVTCMLPDGEKPDDSPATVIVTQQDIRTVETKLSQNEVVAGTDVNVTCTVKNAGSEKVEWDTEVVVTPDNLEVTDHTIAADAIGQYAVACRAVGLPIIDETPASLSVTAGEPAAVRATIKEEEVEAGTEVMVFCTVEDSYGNVLDIPATVDPQEGISVDGTTIVPLVAGEYDVTCSPTEDAGELEQISDHLVVTAGPIASVKLSASPKKKAYKVGDKVTVTGEAADAQGNPVVGEFEVVITAPEGMKASGEKWEFTQEGAFTFVGTLGAPYEDISGELTLYCDESGPDLVLFTPERGATLTGDVMVDVEGHAADLLSAEIDLEINGTSVPVDKDGNFFHVVEGAHGMNILTVEAKDDFGNSSKIVQSFYYSTEWVDYASENIADVLLEQSLVVFLGHNFLDDGDHDKQHIDDVATLVELLLDSLDFGAILPPDLPVVDTEMPGIINVPLLNQMGFELSLVGDLAIKVYLEEISFATPYVGIVTRDGGIDMTISFSGPPEDPGIFLQTTVQLNFGLTVESKFGGNDLVSVGIEPGVALQSSIGIEMLLVETSLDISKNVGEELDITVADLNIVPSGFDIEPIKSDTKLILGPINLNGQGIIDLGTVDLGQLGFVQTVNQFLSDNIIDPVLDFVVPAVLDLVEPMVEEQVTKMLGSLLNQFELDLPLPMPALPGQDQAVTLGFRTRLSAVHFDNDGGQVGLAAGFMAPKGVDRDVLGSLLRAGCGGKLPGEPSFDSNEKFEIAAALDMVNELFFSLWWGGGLKLALDETVLGGISIDQFGITDLSVDTDFYLAPILDDCTAKGMVELQVGDLLLKPSFKVLGAPVTIEMFVSAAMDATVYGDGQEIGLNINGITDIGTQIVTVEGNLGALLGGLDIEDLVENVLVPMIVEQVSNLSLGNFPIPEIDLSGIVPGIPAGTTLSLGNLVIDLSKGYLIIGGELL